MCYIKNSLQSYSDIAIDLFLLYCPHQIPWFLWLSRRHGYDVTTRELASVSFRADCNWYFTPRLKKTHTHHIERNCFTVPHCLCSHGFKNNIPFSFLSRKDYLNKVSKTFRSFRSIPVSWNAVLDAFPWYRRLKKSFWTAILLASGF